MIIRRIGYAVLAVGFAVANLVERWHAPRTRAYNACHHEGDCRHGAVTTRKPKP